jgi:hypothetical protein
MGANGEYGDRASAGASVTAVPWSLRSRRYVEGSALLRAHRFSATFSTTEAITLTWAVEGDSATSARDKNTWTTGTGGEQSIPRQSVAGNAEGRGLSWELSASSVQPFSIRDVFVIAGLTDRL